MNTPNNSTAERTGGSLNPAGSAKTSDQEKERRRNILGGIHLEGDSCSDNLAVALMCYFEHHIEKPDDGQEDDYGNSKWASEKTDEALNRIAETIWPNAESSYRSGLVVASNKPVAQSARSD